MSVAFPSDPPPPLATPGALRRSSDERSTPTVTGVDSNIGQRLSQPPDMTEVRPPRRPQSLLGAVPYAISVLRHRRRALALLGQVQHESEDAERRRDSQLALLARTEEAGSGHVPALEALYRNAAVLQRAVDELESQLARAERVSGQDSSEVLSLRGRLAFARRDVEMTLCQISRTAMDMALPGFASHRGEIAAADQKVAALGRRLQAVSRELAEVDSRWVRKGLALGATLLATLVLLLIWLVWKV